MGVFDFMKSAGAKIFGKDDDKADVTKPLGMHLREHGIDPSGIRFSFSGDTVVMEGTVPDQDTREKAVLIVGNVDGIGRVDDRLRVGANFGGVSATTSSTAAMGTAAGSGATVAHGSAGSAGGGDWASRTYTVESGDSLSAIAKKMYGDAGKYQKIFEANQPMLKDPDKIYPGQVLRIPADS